MCLESFADFGLPGSFCRHDLFTPVLHKFKRSFRPILYASCVLQRQGDLFDAFSVFDTSPSSGALTASICFVQLLCNTAFAPSLLSTIAINAFWGMPQPTLIRECQSDIIRVSFLACQIYRTFSVLHFWAPPALLLRRRLVMCTSRNSTAKNCRRIGVQPDRVVLSALIASMWREAEANCIEVHRDVCVRL